MHNPSLALTLCSGLIYQFIQSSGLNNFELVLTLLDVKAYAVSALTKIYAFEIAAGRKVDMLPEVIAEII